MAAEAIRAPMMVRVPRDAQGEHIVGPDVRDASELSQQIRSLNQLIHRPPLYAAAWIAAVRQAGDVHLFIGDNGRESIMIGHAEDDLRTERLRRIDTLMSHLRLSKLREAVVDTLWATGPVAGPGADQPRPEGHVSHWADDLPLYVIAIVFGACIAFGGFA